MSESLFNKHAGLQVFSCELCDIFENNFFTEHLWRLLLALAGMYFMIIKIKLKCKCRRLDYFFEGFVIFHML